MKKSLLKYFPIFPMLYQNWILSQFPFEDHLYGKEIFKFLAIYLSFYNDAYIFIDLLSISWMQFESNKYKFASRYVPSLLLWKEIRYNI